uniref:Uncharacterized protein n=1 Tax=Knipowitschia caucasica TaxID=637954 RepID=A0AAV2KNT9_KNICA
MVESGEMVVCVGMVCGYYVFGRMGVEGGVGGVLFLVGGWDRGVFEGWRMLLCCWWWLVFVLWVVGVFEGGGFGGSGGGLGGGGCWSFEKWVWFESIFWGVVDGWVGGGDGVGGWGVVGLGIFKGMGVGIWCDIWWWMEWVWLVVVGLGGCI